MWFFPIIVLSTKKERKHKCCPIFNSLSCHNMTFVSPLDVLCVAKHQSCLQWRKINPYVTLSPTILIQNCLVQQLYISCNVVWLHLLLRELVLEKFTWDAISLNGVFNEGKWFFSYSTPFFFPPFYDMMLMW